MSFSNDRIKFYIKTGNRRFNINISGVDTSDDGTTHVAISLPRVEMKEVRHSDNPAPESKQRPVITRINPTTRERTRVNPGVHRRETPQSTASRSRLSTPGRLHNRDTTQQSTATEPQQSIEHPEDSVGKPAGPIQTTSSRNPVTVQLTPTGVRLIYTDDTADGDMDKDYRDHAYTSDEEGDNLPDVGSDRTATTQLPRTTAHDDLPELLANQSDEEPAGQSDDKFGSQQELYRLILGSVLSATRMVQVNSPATDQCIYLKGVDRWRSRGIPLRHPLDIENILRTHPMFNMLVSTDMQNVTDYIYVVKAFDSWILSKLRSDIPEVVSFAKKIDEWFGVKLLKFVNYISDDDMNRMILLLNNPKPDETAEQAEIRQLLAILVVDITEKRLEHLVNLFNMSGCTCMDCMV